MANIYDTLHPQGTSDNLYPNVIPDKNIPNKSIDGVKLKDSSISGTKLIDGSIDESKLKGNSLDSIVNEWLEKHPDVTTTVVDNSITLSKLSVDLKPLSYVPLTYRASAVVYTGIINNSDNILFGAKSIAITSNGTQYEGIETIITPIIGKTLYLKATRDVGNDWIGRIVIRDSSGTLISNKQLTTSGGTIELEVPTNAYDCVIDFVISWGTALDSGTLSTLTNVEYGYIEVTNELDSSQLPVTSSKLSTLIYDFTSLTNVSNRLRSITYGNIYNNIDNVLLYVDNIKYVTSTINYQGISTTFKLPIKNRMLNVKVDRTVGYNFASRLRFFNSSGSQLFFATATSGNVISMYVTDDCDYCEVVFAVTWGTVIDDNTEGEFNNLKIWYSDTGVGDYSYKGYQPINLKFKNYRMNYTDLSIIDIDEWNTLTGATTGSNQSCAVYNDYVFLFNPTTSVVIFNINDTTTKYTATMPYSSHANSAQFIDVKYDDSDTYPLLVISNCEQDGTVASLNVLRVTQVDTTFTFTLVKTIYINNEHMINYGFSVAIDVDRKKLIGVTFKNGGWALQTDNPVQIIEFDYPNSWIGVDETISDSNNIIGEYPYFVIQGATYYDGILYLATQIKTTVATDYYRVKYSSIGNSYMLFDAVTGKLLNIGATYHVEPEGICIYNEKLYISSRNNTTTGNVLYFTEFDFNLGD